MRTIARNIAVSVIALSAAAGADDAGVWWEGESPVRTNFPQRSWFTPANAAERDKLSAGAWLSSDGKRTGDALFAAYEVPIPKAGTYHLWARKFWKHGPFRWRFGEQDWRTCGRDVTLADNVTLRQHVCANWVSLGEVTLPAGRQTFRIELLAGPGESATAAFDCFYLTPGAFVPRGRLKPGDKYGEAPPGWFAFEPDVDEFRDAELDLRGLNHRVAGQKGFLQSRGDRFVFEKDPTPVRFWAVNASPMADRQADAYFARHAAKLGVNMVRIHGAVFDRSARDPATINRKRLDQIHRFVAALKKEGIYVTLSFYFPLWFDVRPEYGIAGYEDAKSKKPFTLLFFHPRMQAIYRSWARGLMTTKNPYTGLSLAADPAVGLVEIINEDNYFFWTATPYQNIPAPASHMLEARFGRWLATRYGSIDKALAAWGPSKVKGDDPAAGRVGLYGPWFYKDEARRQRNDQRIGDQVRFLSEDLRGFYEDMHAWFRTELGVQCPMVATNWKTADDRLLGALDKYTNTACETLDRHAYFGGKHEGDGASYSVRKGHRYADASLMRDPGRCPVRDVQYTGHTHIVSEFNYPMPNRFRAECVPLAAAYGALQGTDGYYHFATGSASWEATHPKFSIHTPVMMGQFPAAAVIYRRGDVREGPVVVHEAAKLADLYALRGTAVAEPQALDALRAADVPPGQTAPVERVGSIDPLAFFVGQVTRTVGDDPGPSRLADLSRFIDRRRQTVTRATGELTWDYRRGVVTIDAPCAQGAVGFLGAAGRIDLNTVSITLRNDYGVVLVVSLDAQPLGESARVLVQVMTEDANNGWTTSGDPLHTITSLGGPPIVVRRFDGQVRLAGPARTVTGLDANGYRRTPVKAAASPDGVTFYLLPDCLYYLVVRP